MLPQKQSAYESLQQQLAIWSGLAFGLLIVVVVVFIVAWNYLVIDVPAGHMAVLIRLTGQDLQNGDEVAPDAKHKGVQKEPLGEGRFIMQYNPYDWDWEVIPQLVIPEGKLGVRVRLAGDDLPYGQFLAREPNQKGIVPGVLNPGRYAINPYLEKVIQFDPVIVPAGFRGVVTNLSGPIPMRAEDYDGEVSIGRSKQLLVKPGFRGVARATLEAGTYYLNPYESRVSLVDCRSQRFNLAEKRDMGFPSKDGFWVSLDGVVEFRIRPDMAAIVYILYRSEAGSETLDAEIVKKVILPTARSFCRLQGSNNLGREFISGSSRTEFQDAFQTALRHECEPLGIEIRQALITSIRPPEQIALPVRTREIAKQNEKQYQQQILQQKSEQSLAIEKEMVNQRQALVGAAQSVVRITTDAKREQEVAITKAEEELAVAKLKLEAAKDEAEAFKARGVAAAKKVELENAAEAAGWKAAVTAFGGDGGQYAQYVLYTKIGSAYRNLMVNTADSPLMKIFDRFGSTGRTGAGSKSTDVKSAASEKTPPAATSQPESSRGN